MDRELWGEFFSGIMCYKKLEAAFSSACQAQMNELLILQRIAEGCGEHGGVNLDMPNIQETLQISRPAISYLLNSLEKKRYIIREIDARDRRKISISPTAAGRLAAEQSARRQGDLWAALLARFGEAEMRQLTALLTRLSAICEDLGANPGQDE